MMPCRHLPVCSEITLFVGQGFIVDGTGDQVKVGSRARLLDRGPASQLQVSIDSVNTSSRYFWSM